MKDQAGNLSRESAILRGLDAQAEMRTDAPISPALDWWQSTGSKIKQGHSERADAYAKRVALLAFEAGMVY